MSPRRSRDDLLRAHVPVFVYDGGCRFCTNWWTWLRPRLGDRVVAVAFDDLLNPASLGLSRADIARSSMLLTEDLSHRRNGSAGIAAMLKLADWPLKAVGYAMSIPPLSWASAAAYRMVASNRHRLPSPRDRATPGPPT
jgi:predicted DCC family thiol-disulfide oxidoreductase YuxK